MQRFIAFALAFLFCVGNSFGQSASPREVDTLAALAALASSSNVTVFVRRASTSDTLPNGTSREMVAVPWDSGATNLNRVRSTFNPNLMWVTNAPLEAWSAGQVTSIGVGLTNSAGVLKQSIEAGSNITLATNANTITFSATGDGGGNVFTGTTNPQGTIPIWGSGNTNLVGTTVEINGTNVYMPGSLSIGTNLFASEVRLRVVGTGGPEAIFDTSIGTDARFEFRRLGVRQGLFGWDAGTVTFEGDSSQSSSILFRAAGAQRMTISGTTGNVGVGTGSPTGKLSVQTGTSGDGIIVTDGAGLVRAKLLNNASIGGQLELWNAAGNATDTIFSSRSGVASFINNGGNFGLGDSTPAAMLTVGSGDLFQINSSGNIIRVANIVQTFPITNSLEGQVFTRTAAGQIYYTNLPSGTVTSVNVAESGFTSSGAVTSSGTITMTPDAGAGASATTAYFGDGTWKSLAINGTWLTKTLTNGTASQVFTVGLASGASGTIYLKTKIKASGGGSISEYGLTEFPITAINVGGTITTNLGSSSFSFVSSVAADTFPVTIDTLNTATTFTVRVNATSSFSTPTVTMYYRIENPDNLTITTL